MPLGLDEALGRRSFKKRMNAEMFEVPSERRSRREDLRQRESVDKHSRMEMGTLSRRVQAGVPRGALTMSAPRNSVASDTPWRSVREADRVEPVCMMR